MWSKEEQEIFKAFIATEPNFAGEPVNWSGGADPPDVLCESGRGRRIGVELVEWLHESQTTRARTLETLEREIAEKVPKQSLTDWVSQYTVLLYPAPNVFPSKAERPKFMSELFNLLHQFKNSAYGHERRDPKDLMII